MDTFTDWELFEQYLEPKHFQTKIPKGQLKAAFRLLRKTASDKLGVLFASAPNAEFRIKFSRDMTAATRELGWSTATAQRVVSVLKKVLRKTPICAEFITTLRLSPDRPNTNKLIGKYGRLPEDHPARELLESWIAVVRRRTRCKADGTLRNIMSFYSGMCRELQLDLSAWDANKLQQKLSDETVIRLLGNNHNSTKKLRWLKLFLRHIVQIAYTVPLAVEDRVDWDARARTAAQPQVEGDMHRIMAADLDKIYVVSRENTRDELCYLLMITTGMRVGGVANLKYADLAQLSGDKWKVKTQGRTLEKDSKIFHFMMTPRVQELVATWLTRERPADSGPYLFPGRLSGHVTTTAIRKRFKLACRKAKLSGPQFHPHALRHSYAHILLENGNPPEIVSKLMNHSSTAITEKFYLRENTAQVMSRANVPWFKDVVNNHPKDPLPVFLKEVRSNANIKRGKQSRKRKQLEQLQQLAKLRKTMK